MSTPRGSLWGPPPLPDFLRDQLQAHGFTAGDAARCVRQINARPGPAAVASLFVDLGSLKLLEGDIDGAVATWRHALVSEHDAAGARALVNLGLLYEHLHLHDRAIGVLHSVAEREVQSYVRPAASAIARCQRSLGDTTAAMETMARLAQSVMVEQPDSTDLAESFYALGEIAEDSGRLDRAERAWRAASAGPTSPAQQAATERLAGLLLEQGHDDELLDLFERHPSAMADHVPAMLDRAEALHRLGHEDQATAIVASVGAQDLVPADRFRLAEVRLQIGLINEAIDEFEVLLSDPSTEVQQRAAFALGEVYRSYDMAEAAISMYERVVDEQDRYWSPRAALSLGDVLAADGQVEAATANWSIAAECQIAVIRNSAQSRLDAEPREPVDVAAVVAGEDGGDLDAADSPIGFDAEPGEDGGDLDTVDSPTGLDAELREPVDVTAPDPALESGPSAPASTVEIVSLAELEQRAADEAHEAHDPAPRPEPEVTTEPVVLVLADLEAGDYSSSPHSDSVAIADDLTEPTLGESIEQPDTPAAPESDDAPVVINLEEIEEESEPVSRPTAFASLLRAPAADLSTMPNPYAALAPDGHATDVEPSARNPYAELAPNFAEDAFEPNPDIEPGDWESMLDDWPRHEPTKPKKSPRKRPSAFSRYT